MSRPAIVCIGEFLWDVLPTGCQPGGLPFHVAAHLRHLGQPAQLVSRVGHDALGTGLLAALDQVGLDRHLVQGNQTHLTGVVKVSAGNGTRLYKIVEPVAWDFIQYTAPVRAAVAGARMLVFGSLAARHATTRETLYRLLPAARFKVFDVALHSPHYSRTVVKYLLRQADLVRLNERELTEIMGWLGQPATPATALPWLAAHFHLQTICLTAAPAGGVMLWHDHHLLCRPAPPDRAGPGGVGRNDAFLAALLARWGESSPAECLEYALHYAARLPCLLPVADASAA